MIFTSYAAFYNGKTINFGKTGGEAGPRSPDLHRSSPVSSPPAYGGLGLGLRRHRLLQNVMGNSGRWVVTGGNHRSVAGDGGGGTVKFGGVARTRGRTKGDGSWPESFTLGWRRPA